MTRNSPVRADPSESSDGLDEQRVKRVADRARSGSGGSNDHAAPHHDPGRGEDAHGDAPGASDGQAHRPAAGLDDPRVSAVPETTAGPGESDAHAAARLRRSAGQDPWGEPEDRPDHDGNEAYRQQDETQS
jgi:hypothetical protein